MDTFIRNKGCSQTWCHHKNGSIKSNLNTTSPSGRTGIEKRAFQAVRCWCCSSAKFRKPPGENTKVWTYNILQHIVLSSMLSSYMLIIVYPPSGPQLCWQWNLNCIHWHRSEYVRESEFYAPPAWYKQQFCCDRYPGAFLCSDLHWLWLLSLQTKVCCREPNIRGDL